MKPTSVTTSPAGLTLVELLVVLSIVAVLSTVALRSVVGVFEETNYNANLSQMEELEAAIVGDSTSGGFLGDIGRLPIARGIVPEEQLAELWDQSAGSFSDYNIASPMGDSEVRLGTGWRGPYLNLGINRRDLFDGFANPFVLYGADVSVAGNGNDIRIIQSAGANRTVDGADTSYDEDLELVFEADATAVTAGLADAAANHWQSDIEVIVERDGSPIEFADGRNVIVRAYGADGAGGVHTVVQEETPTLTANIPSQTFTLSNLPYGAKILRAYQRTGVPADEVLITTISPERKSPATHIVIDRFTSTITLTLY